MKTTTRPAGQAELGTHLDFKRHDHHIIETYGAGATITGRCLLVSRRAHPGVNGVTILSLLTDNGTEVEWDQSTVSVRFKRMV